MALQYDENGFVIGDDGLPSDDQMRLELSKKQPTLKETVKQMVNNPANDISAFWNPKGVAQGFLSAGESALRGIGSGMLGMTGDMLEHVRTTPLIPGVTDKVSLKDVLPGLETIAPTPKFDYQPKQQPNVSYAPPKEKHEILGVPYVTSKDLREAFPQRYTPEFGDKTANDFMEELGLFMTPFAVEKGKKAITEGLELAGKIPNISKDAAQAFARDYANAMNGIYPAEPTAGSRAADLAKATKSGAQTVGDVAKKTGMSLAEKGLTMFEEGALTPGFKPISEAVRRRGEGIVLYPEGENVTKAAKDRSGVFELTTELKENLARNSGQSVNDYANMIIRRFPNLDDDSIYQTNKALQEFALDKQMEEFGQGVENPTLAYVKNAYSNATPEVKEEFNDRVLSEFINQFNAENRASQRALRLPSLEEFKTRRDAASKWLDTVARNYIEKDVGAVTTKEGKDVSSDIILKLMAEGYTPYSDEKIARIVKDLVNQTEMRKERKELGFEGSGYFAPEISVLVKSLNKEEKGLNKLLEEFNSRYTHAMDVNSQRQARGEETLDPGTIDPTLRELKKQEKAIRAKIREFEHQIAENKNAQKMEFAVDQALGYGHPLNIYKQNFLANPADLASFPKVMNVPEQFASETKIYNPSPYRLKDIGIRKIFNDYIEDVMQGKITIKNGVPTKPLDGFIKEKYKQNRAEMREERFAKEDFLPAIKAKLKDVVDRQPAIDRFQRPNDFGNFRVVNTDYTNDPQDIRLRLSEATETLDHCIGRGASASNETHWRTNVSRDYIPLYNPITERPNKNVSSSDSDYMKYAMFGKEEYPELRDKRTGLPEVTFRFQRSDWPETELIEAMRDAVMAMPETNNEVLSIIRNSGSPIGALLKLQREYPRFGLEAAKAYWEVVNELPRKFSIDFVSGFRNQATNKTPELVQAMIEFLNSRSDEIVNGGGSLSKWGIYDTEKNMSNLTRDMNLDEEDRERLNNIQLPRFATKETVEEALRSAPPITAETMTKPYKLSDIVARGLNSSSLDFTDHVFRIANRIADVNKNPERFLQVVESELQHAPEYYSNPTYVTNTINEINKIVSKVKEKADLNNQFHQLSNTTSADWGDGQTHHIADNVATNPYRYVKELERSLSSYKGEILYDVLKRNDIYSTPQDLARTIRTVTNTKFPDLATDRPEVVREMNAYADFLESTPSQVKERPAQALSEDVIRNIENVIEQHINEAPGSIFEDKVNEIIDEGLNYRYEPDAYVNRLRELANEESVNGSTARAERFRRLANVIQKKITGIDDSAGISSSLVDFTNNLMHDNLISPNARAWMRESLHNFNNNPQDVDRFVTHLYSVIREKVDRGDTPHAVAGLNYIANNLMRGQSKLTFPPSDILESYANKIPAPLFSDLNRIASAQTTNIETSFDKFQATLNDLIDLTPASSKTETLKIILADLARNDALRNFNKSLNVRTDLLPQADIPSFVMPQDRSQIGEAAVNHILNVYKNYKHPNMNKNRSYGERFYTTSMPELGFRNNEINTFGNDMLEAIRDKLNEIYGSEIEGMPNSGMLTASDSYKRGVNQVNELPNSEINTYGKFMEVRNAIRNGQGNFEGASPIEKLEFETKLVDKFIHTPAEVRPINPSEAQNFEPEAPTSTLSEGRRMAIVSDVAGRLNELQRIMGRPPTAEQISNAVHNYNLNGVEGYSPEERDYFISEFERRGNIASGQAPAVANISTSAELRPMDFVGQLFPNAEQTGDVEIGNQLLMGITHTQQQIARMGQNDVLEAIQSLNTRPPEETMPNWFRDIGGENREHVVDYIRNILQRRLDELRGQPQGGQALGHRRGGAIKKRIRDMKAELRLMNEGGQPDPIPVPKNYPPTEQSAQNALETIRANNAKYAAEEARQQLRPIVEMGQANKDLNAGRIDKYEHARIIAENKAKFNAMRGSGAVGGGGGIIDNTIKQQLGARNPFFANGGIAHMGNGGFYSTSHKLPDSTEVSDTGYAGDTDSGDYRIGLQKQKIKSQISPTVERNASYAEYGQPFAEGRLSGRITKPSSDTAPEGTYMGNVNYQQGLGNGNINLGLMASRELTPEQKIKLRMLSAMYNEQLGKDSNISAGVVKPIGGGKPMVNVRYNKSFKDGGDVSIDEMRLLVTRKK